MFYANMKKVDLSGPFFVFFLSVRAILSFQCRRRAISVAAQRPENTSPVSISQLGKSQLADLATCSSADCS